MHKYNCITFYDNILYEVVAHCISIIIACYECGYENTMTINLNGASFVHLC